MTFDEKEDCQTLTPETKSQRLDEGVHTITTTITLALYARLRVTNIKPRIAERCQGYLVRIEEKVNGEWKDTSFSDSMPLVWSYDADHAEVDIPNGITRHIDLLSVRDNKDGFLPHIRSSCGTILSPIHRYEPIFNRNGTFRFTVLVSAQEIKPKRRRVTLVWDGKLANKKLFTSELETE